MRGVEEINRVLEEDPDHFQARFNKGIMLTMIGRAEEAIQQFERVKEIVGTDSPYYQQANQAIETIRSRMSSESESS
jgi:tetratricopeptide (TPR) repeat protein